MINVEQCTLIDGRTDSMSFNQQGQTSRVMSTPMTTQHPSELVEMRALSYPTDVRTPSRSSRSTSSSGDQAAFATPPGHTTARQRWSLVRNSLSKITAQDFAIENSS